MKEKEKIITLATDIETELNNYEGYLDVVFSKLKEIKETAMKLETNN